MKYLFRLLVYIVIFCAVYSVSSVIVLRFVPVTVTPLKVLRLIENFPKRGIAVDSRWVSLENISAVMPQAVMATEDNRFLEHQGFDWEAINQAINDNKSGKNLRGGSIISQQTAKNVFCLPARTWFRKGIEAYFTVLTELFWSKERIMEVYLNVIETGVNMYGVEASARKVYGKRASSLNKHEASMIATVLPNPLKMNLKAPSSYMVRRAERVRQLMNMLGPVDFDNPSPPEKEKKRK